MLDFWKHMWWWTKSNDSILDLEHKWTTKLKILKALNGGDTAGGLASVSSPLCGNHFLVCTICRETRPKCQNVRISSIHYRCYRWWVFNPTEKLWTLKKYLKPPLSIDNIALHMIATNFNPLQPEMMRLFWMDSPAKRRYKRKRVWFWDGLFQWPCLLCMSQNLGMSLVCLKKLPQKLTPVGWKTCIYIYIQYIT